MHIALSIAGSDPSGGAGLQADLKVFQRFGIYGMGIISLHTVQNSLGVSEIESVSPLLLEKQLAALNNDFKISAVKTAALADEKQIEVIAKYAKKISAPLIIDPIFSSSSSKKFFSEQAKISLREKLLSLAFLITPNLEEASELSGIRISDKESTKEAAKVIQALGVKNVLIKGGHANSDDCRDMLLSDEQFFEFSQKRILNSEIHGTGCALSAAITASIAKGEDLSSSVELAKEFITKAIQDSLSLGKGSKYLVF